MKDVRADPIALLMAGVYFAAIGWFIGRIMLRNEQRRDRWEANIGMRLYEVEAEARTAKSHARAAYEKLFNPPESDVAPETAPA